MIVRTDSGHHVRLMSGNHKIVWITENYEREAKAQKAINFLERAFGILNPLPIKHMVEAEVPDPIKYASPTRTRVL